MRFPCTARDNTPTSLMPILSLALANDDRTVQVEGLLDTGSAVNVLPWHTGLELGASWEAQTTVVPLAGTLGQVEARALVVSVESPQITLGNSVQLVFAWTRMENVPLIFGQMNFFLEFDICFYRSQGFFYVRLKENSKTT